MPVTERPERNWIPVGAAAAVVIGAAAAVFVVLGHGKSRPAVTPITAPADAYSVSLPISNLVMSESSSLSGGKVTYLDGHVKNAGSRTVTGITVQVLFRDFAHEVANNFTQPLTLIRTRDPYVDVEPLSAAPIAPGGEADFRLIFEGVKPDWDGAYPEVRILRVDTK
jgi:hypothetical protein